MPGRFVRLLQAFAIAATITAPVMAHHSAANYDLSTEVTVSGTVVEWIWQNPHCILRFDAKDDSGATRSWTVEVQNPTAMTARGWSRRMFNDGEAVTVSLHPERTGAPIGLITKVVLPDGKTFEADPLGNGAAAARPVSSN
jgi:hypothetical protein